MVEFLIYILIALAVIVIIFVAVVATRPSEFRIVRSAAMLAPAPVVFAQVNDFHKWEAWSPWLKLDPAAKSTYEGAPAGTGAIFKWSGNRHRWSKEDFAKRGDAIFEKDIRPHLKNENDNDFVAIDIETGVYETAANEIAACDRLRARVPDAQVWHRKVGSRFARRFGGRGRPTGK